jgi:hypothetical protein
MSRVAVRASLPNGLISARVAPSSALLASSHFAKQVPSATRNQAINQILYDRTPHDSKLRPKTQNVSAISCFVHQFVLSRMGA